MYYCVPKGIVMNIKKINIKDNIDLCMINTDKFKMSRLSISFITEADRILSPMRKLMFSTIMRGSEKYPTVSIINRELDELYGSTVSFRYSTDGDRHVFTFVCEMLDERYVYKNDNVNILHGTLEILKDILTYPLKDDDGLLPKNFVESERRLACDAIKVKSNDQRVYSADKCKTIMFKDQRCGYSIDGNEEILTNITREELTNCHKSIFDSSKIQCFYIGSKSEEEIKSSISYLFSDVTSGGKIEYGYKPFISDKECTYHEEEKPVSQGRLNIGMRAGIVISDKEYYATSLFNEIFGGSSISKLFMNVREKKSLCYYCSSVYMISKGVIFISCGIKSENKDAAYNEIMYQLEEMKKGNFTDADITTAKKLLYNALTQVNDSPSGLDSYYFRRNMAGIPHTPEESIKLIEDVTKEDIMRVAKKITPDTVYFLKGTEEDGCDE